MRGAANPGELCEPLSGRTWDPATVGRQWQWRAAVYAAAGVGHGDLVFLHHGNSLEFFGDLLALWALGAVAAPVDPRLTAFEIETLARAARPRVALWASPPAPGVEAALTGLGAVVLTSPRADDLGVGAEVGERALEAPRPDDDALVLFTSGTTGSPKAVVHTHGSLRARWAALRTHVDPDDLRRTLCLLPTHFGHGLICNALYPWLSGQRLAVLPPFRSEVILQLGALIDEHQITFLSSVPALWRLALRATRAPRAGTLRRVFCGSAPLSAAMWRDIGAWTRTAAVSNVYGLTETASWLAGSAPGTRARGRADRASVGRGPPRGRLPARPGQRAGRSDGCRPARRGSCGCGRPPSCEGISGATISPPTPSGTAGSGRATSDAWTRRGASIFAGASGTRSTGAA